MTEKTEPKFHKIAVEHEGVKLSLPAWVSSGRVLLRCTKQGFDVQLGESYGVTPDAAVRHLVAGRAVVDEGAALEAGLTEGDIKLANDLPNLAKNLAAAAQQKAAALALEAAASSAPPSVAAGEGAEVVRSRRGR